MLPLSGCSAKEESAEEIPSLDWEKIEESADNGESVMEESAAEQITENVSSESENNAAGSITDKTGSQVSVDELADVGNFMPAAYSSWAYYKLVGIELVLQECVFTSPDEEDITRACWYYTTTEPYEDFSTEITDEQVAEIQDHYTERELSMTVLE